MLSPDLQRISHIKNYCEEIEKTIQRYGNSFSVFDLDADYQRSVSFCILQIGELAGHLSDAYKLMTAEKINWAPMKGMRNMVAHSYGSMSREIIWQTAIEDIPKLKEFCTEQLSSTEN